jgi:hypothetical protein
MRKLNLFGGTVHWLRWPGAIFVVRALAGCGQVESGLGQSPSPPYRQDDPRDISGMH